MTKKTTNKNPGALSVGQPIRLSAMRNLLNHLSPFFEPLGFIRDEKSLAHAAFKKSVNGRIIEVRCSARSSHQFIGVDNISVRRYQGLAMSIRVSTPLKTRVALVPPTGALLNKIRTINWRKFGLKQIATPDPSYAAFDVFTVDPAWANDFLRDKQVLKMMRFWLSEGTKKPAIIFTPEMMGITLSPALEDITPQAAKKWVDSALGLINHAEAKPPTTVVEMTKSEREAMENPRAAGMKLVIKLLAYGVGALFLFGLFLFIAGPKFGIIFLLFFMPVAFFMAAKRFLGALRRKTK